MRLVGHKEIDMDRLHNKVALVTGAGSGIGQACAELFAEEGARVVVEDINGDAAERVAQGIRASGCTAIAVQGDVSVAADAQRMVDAAVNEWGRIDVVISNAGIQRVVESIELLPEEDWDRVIDVNLKGGYLVSKAAIPYMKGQGGGVIVFTGSEMGFIADPQLPVYNASKGGLHMLMKSMAVSLIKHNIRVNAFCPGETNTPLLQSEIDNSSDPEKTKAAYDAWAPIGRMASPREQAYVALFLASDESSFVVGSTYLADGGFTASI
jgi:NAD(P)-dependent dehydrogenase (short-subunit alcohol dehydrogenase family)